MKPDLLGHLIALPLAGITTVKQIQENAFEIKATNRLNHLIPCTQTGNYSFKMQRPGQGKFFKR